MTFIKRFLPIIILFLLAIIYTRPFFSPGFFPTHDGEWSIVRLSEMWREIRDFQIPPRWSDYLNHGYGYPLFNFTYPLPYYLGLLPKLIGFGFTDSIKIIFIASTLLGSLFMFLLGREIGGSFSGLVASIFYTVVPYKLVDLYVRGSIGESLSLALIPGLFYVSIQYILKPTLARLSLTSIIFALTLLSHNIMAIFFIPLWILFLYATVISYFQNPIRYTLHYFLPMIVLGLGLSAYFIFPAIFEKKYLILSNLQLASLKENFIDIPEFIDTSWDYGIKPSFQLGITAISAMIISLVGVTFSDLVNRKKYFPLLLYLLFTIVILIFLSNELSLALWLMPPLSWIDFPWRLLGPLTFLVSLSLVFLSIHKITKFTGILLAVVVIIANLQYAKPSSYFQKNDDYYLTNDATTTSMDELTPIWVIQKPTNRYNQKVEVLNGDAIINNLKFNSNSISFDAISSLPSTISINTIYFPGWEFYANNQKLLIDYSNPQGIMRFNLPVGNNKIVGRLIRTPIRLFADVITFLSILTVILLTVKAIILDRFIAANVESAIETTEFEQFPPDQSEDEELPSQEEEEIS